MELDKKTVETLQITGFLSAKFERYEGIYATFKDLRKTYSFTDSILYTSEKCAACESVVRRAVKEFRTIEGL